MATKKERRAALEGMLKKELVKTMLALDTRQTALLNRIAELEQIAASRSALAPDAAPDNTTLRARQDDVTFPWETK